MKKIRQFIRSFTLALVGLLCFATVAMATLGDVSNFTANPSDTSMILTWTPASGSTNTTVSYRTDTYPVIPSINQLSNASFESGDPPTSWNASGTTISRSNTYAQIGTYSLKVIGGGVDTYAYFTLPASLIGENVTEGAWVWTDTPNFARLTTWGGANYSNYHTGDSTWQWLTVTNTISAVTQSAILITDGVATAYFDGAVLTCSDGQSVYNGNSYQCTVSGLTAGTAYYFSAWGISGDSYNVTPSTNPAHCMMSTLAVVLPSGGQETPKQVIPIPTVPSSANQTPSSANFTNFEPFVFIVTYFTSGTGGLGMPVDNLWEVLAIGVIVSGGLFVYKGTKSILAAYVVLMLLTCFGLGFHLVQGYLLVLEVIIGAGVWAIDRTTQ